MTSIEPHPTSPPPTPPFQFTSRTLLLLFVVLGSSLAVFGGWGLVVFGLVMGLAIYIRYVGSRLALEHFYVIFVWGLLLLYALLMADGSVKSLWTSDSSAEDLRKMLQVGGFEETDPAATIVRPDWPNIAALAVWLLSVGTLLTHAVRSRKVLPVPPPPS